MSNEKKIEDYLHLYFNSEVKWREHTYQCFHCFKGLLEGLQSEVKLILRPLSSMTEDEKKEIYKLIFKKQFPASGIIFYRPDKTLTSEPRYILSTGVDRVGIEMNGTVWADCDLQNYKHNQHEITLYLLSKHFDLFNLIESGLAIDKTKHKI